MINCRHWTGCQGTTVLLKNPFLGGWNTHRGSSRIRTVNLHIKRQSPKSRISYYTDTFWLSSKCSSPPQFVAKLPHNCHSTDRSQFMSRDLKHDAELIDKIAMGNQMKCSLVDFQLIYHIDRSVAYNFWNCERKIYNKKSKLCRIKEKEDTKRFSGKRIIYEVSLVHSLFSHGGFLAKNKVSELQVSISNWLLNLHCDNCHNNSSSALHNSTCPMLSTADQIRNS